MATDIGSGRGNGGATESVVATVDPSETGAEFVIADISRDRSWIAVPESAAVSLDGKR